MDRKLTKYTYPDGFQKQSFSMVLLLLMPAKAKLPQNGNILNL
jgi:hypothetical protein